MHDQLTEIRAIIYTLENSTAIPMERVPWLSFYPFHNCDNFDGKVSMEVAMLLDMTLSKPPS